MTDRGDVLLEARGISKSFPGVKALDGVGLTLRSGRLTALLGENGAGKSTLMNVVAGVFPPDAGELLVMGRPVRFTSPRHAQDRGIAMIFQELNLVPGLTVAENMFLGREPLRRSGLIDYAALNRKAAAWLQRLDQQKVILAKWLAAGPKVLLLDEPTRGIDIQAKKEIYALIDELTGAGLAVVAVSSELPEILAVSDRILVLCEGRLTAEFARAEATEEKIMHAALPRKSASLC